MTDARNDYPRLCWGCLATIEDFEHDAALCTYGGYCYHCIEQPDMEGLREMTRPFPERMNDVDERSALLVEARAYQNQEVN